MYTKVTEIDFLRAFRHKGLDEGWTLEGMQALYNYLIAQEEQTDTPIELDPVVFNCDYMEYSSVSAAEEDIDPDDIFIVARLNNGGVVIEY